jgi:predicted aminopeptidase
MQTKACAMLALLLSIPITTGCYYAHLVAGQTRLLLARRSLDTVLEDPTTAPDVRDHLLLVQEARQFARDLGLAVEGQYTSYADWPGDRVVTTVVATRPGELEPVGFRFPIVGRVPYKGFFDLDRAEQEAERLRSKGMDVCTVAVPAYSTLGWFDDPVTAPMLHLGEGGLVETVLHELVHATVFAASAARFNEGVATFVGEEASIRFFEARDGVESESAVARRERVTDDRRVAAALLELRESIAEIYEEEAPGTQRRAARAELAKRARERIAALPLRRSDPSQVSARLRLGDACLALVGTYQADLPRYAERLDALEGDLAAFVAEARQAATRGDPGANFLEDGHGNSVGPPRDSLPP